MRRQFVKNTCRCRLAAVWKKKTKNLNCPVLFRIINYSENFSLCKIGLDWRGGETNWAVVYFLFILGGGGESLN